MRPILLALTLCASTALAETCEASCQEMQQQCERQCETVVKKKNPGQVGACKAQCKGFTDECKKECADNAPAKR
jgi:hypothetical protein